MNFYRFLILAFCLFLSVISTALSQPPQLIFHAESWQPDHMYLGQAVCGIGDQNGDGYDDIAIGVGESSYFRSVLIYHGGSPMDSIHDFELTYSTGTLSSYTLKNIGDIDGDGLDELGIVAWLGSEQSQILIYNIGVEPDTIPDLVINSGNYPNTFGRISTAGDFNNNGYDDLLVSQTLYNDTRGRILIYYGAAEMDTIPDWIVNGVDQYDMLGFQLIGGGDLNGDGYDDIAVKEGYYPPDNLYIFFGGAEPDTIPDLTIATEYKFAIVEDLNGDDFDDFVTIDCEFVGYEIYKVMVYFGGVNMDNQCDMELSISSYAGTPSEISSTGDCNGDGYGDIIVGNFNAFGSMGAVYIYFGSPWMDGICDVLFTGGLNIGSVIGECGDVNNDGIDDIMWGAAIPYGYVNIFAGDSAWAVGVEERIPSSPPSDFALIKAYPNPFNAKIAISFQLTADSDVELTVYDLQGREVQTLVTGLLSLGYHEAVFDGSDLSSGIYFIRLTVDSGQSTVKKVVLMK
ncbi:FG-GAP repeat protein [bacterium]|nr:FG-GAP repeat protein [bacterium]